MKTSIVDANNLKKEIDEKLGINIDKNTRQMEYVSYRHAFAYYLYETTTLSDSVIGEIIGRDRTSINHVRDKHDDLLIQQGNKGDAYRLAWQNVCKIANNEPIESKTIETPSQLPSLNGTLRKRVALLELKIKHFKESNEKLREHIKIIEKENNDLNFKIDNDPNFKLDNSPIIKPINHNFKPEPPKPWRGDVYEVSGIKYF